MRYENREFSIELLTVRLSMDLLDGMKMVANVCDIPCRSLLKENWLRSKEIFDKRENEYWVRK